MGLDAVFQNAARVAFAAFKDVQVSARFESVATATYDASAGTASVYCYSGMVSAIFEAYERRLVDGDRIKPQDVKALLLPDGFPRHLDGGAAPKPRPNDTLHVVEANCSVAYRVIDLEVDPANALYILQLRRSG